MTTPAPADTKLRRRWLSPRFSLKMLMLVVTAAAVGAAFWWRWPVTQTTEKKRGSSVTTETFTYHRGLRGDLIKHGVHRIVRDDNVETEAYYREGLLHGPYRRGGWVTGEYFLGEKHGTWRYERRNPSTEQMSRSEEHWNRGKRDGVFQCWDAEGKLRFGLEFKNDRLIAAQNSPSGSLLVRRIADGSLGNPALARHRADGSARHFTPQNVLFADVDLDYDGTPLGEMIEDLQERFAIPLAARWKRKTVVLRPPPAPAEPPQPAMHEIPFSDEWILVEPDDPKGAPQLVDMRPRSLAPPAAAVPPPPIIMETHRVPVTVNEKQTMLLVGFDVFLSPLGLALDYRHGVLCIVDAEGAGDWKDTTGVMDLHPAKETPLSEQLDAPAKVTYLEPLRDVLRNLATTQEISVEFRPANDPTSGLGSIPEEEMVNLIREALMIRNEPSSKSTRPIPITLRQLLGLLLDQANLHCHEEKGVLIIEPPPKEVATQAKEAKP